MIKKIFKPFIKLFKILYLFIDKLIVTPISKLIYRISKISKSNNGKLEKLLNRPTILLYISLACAILIFLLIDRQVITLVDNEAEIITGQPVSIIYNKENYVIDGVPETVDITLIGSKSNLYLAKQLGDHKVELDLTNYTPGKYKVKLKYNHSMDNVKYKLDPSTINIEISEKEMEEFSLTYDLLNENSMDKKLSISNVELSTSKIIVKGSKKALESIAHVKALIDLKKANLTNKGEYDVDSITLVAYDNEGNQVKNVEMVPNSITAKVKVSSYSVELPVKIVTKGTITTGYALSSITSTVSKVTVYGEQDILDKLTQIEAKLDISGLSSDKTFNGIELIKPTGVRYMSDTTTSVTITLDTESSKEFAGIDVEAINVANGYKASAVSITDQTITVIVKGVSGALENLEASKIRAYVDLSGITEIGTHEVDVKLEIDDSRFTLVSTTTKVNIKITKSS